MIEKTLYKIVRLNWMDAARDETECLVIAFSHIIHGRDNKLSDHMKRQE